MRGIRSCSMLSVLLGVTAILSGCASGTDSVGAALKARYRRSLVEINDPRTQSRIVSPGVILILQSEGVSAKRVRVIQANMKTPRFHARDYAQVEIAPDGRLTAAPGDFTLTKGTRLARVPGALTSRVEAILTLAPDTGWAP